MTHPDRTPRPHARTGMDGTPLPCAPVRARPAPRRPASSKAWPIVALAWLAGCASSRTAEHLDDAGLGPDAAPGPAPVDASLPEGFCVEACAVMAEGSCLSPEACSAYCAAQSPRWSEAIGAAFARCVAERPLCFEMVENCMLAELHPPGSTHPVRVVGSGLSDYEGQTVHIWPDPARPPAFRGEARITAGAFTFEWTEAVPSIGDGASTLMLFYIDVDGDGACTNAGDVTMAGSPTWNGDYVEPAFELALAPPLVDPDFICALAP